MKWSAISLTKWRFCFKLLLFSQWGIQISRMGIAAKRANQSLYHICIDEQININRHANWENQKTDWVTWVLPYVSHAHPNYEVSTAHISNLVRTFTGTAIACSVLLWHLCTQRTSYSWDYNFQVIKSCFRVRLSSEIIAKQIISPTGNSQYGLCLVESSSVIQSYQRCPLQESHMLTYNKNCIL